MISKRRINFQLVLNAIYIMMSENSQTEHIKNQIHYPAAISFPKTNLLHTAICQLTPNFIFSTAEKYKRKFNEVFPANF